MEGVYCLIIRLDKEQKIKIGSLGEVKFPKGFYVYTGSALKGLRARINRHRKKQKKLFWHIDYFLASKHAKVSKAIAIRTNKRLECKLNKAVSNLPNAKVLVKGFGCSDCSCKSHLVYFGNKSLAGLLKSKLKFTRVNNF
ncbi:MAG: GIY-YIG nuclease family protein [Candidatus Aenigmarchaeota archaeon]|nr:GIY-YIG nuclease family protein [Candidatus Aenigmarchaeota archaeon]